MPMQIDPRFLAQNPATGFQLPPRYPVPATIPSPIAQGLGPSPLEEAAKMSKLKAFATSPFGRTLGLLSIGMLADDQPGKHFDPFLGINPNNEPDDLGITSLGKSSLRGFANMGNSVAGAVDKAGEYSPFFTVPEYLFTTNEAKAAKRDKDKAGIQTADETPAGTGFKEQAPSEYVIPGIGGLQDSSLDDLLKVIAASRPSKSTISPELKRDVGISDALSAGAETAKGNYSKWGSLLEGLAGGYKKQAVDIPLAALGQEKEYNKNLLDWLKEYARTGVDVAKEKREAKKDDFKVHSTRNGLLIEMNDKEGNKILKPIMGGDSGGSINIDGMKFRKDTPLKEEFALLQNLSDVGLLGDVLAKEAKRLADNKVGAGHANDPKLQAADKIAAIAALAHSDPQFKAQLIEIYKSSVGSKPRANLWDSSPPAAGAEDYVTTISNGLAK